MSNNENILKGAGYKAKVKFYTCKGSGVCIKVCPEKAIYRRTSTDARCRMYV